MNGADFPPKIYISSEMRLAEWLCKGPGEWGSSIESWVQEGG